MLLSPSTGGMVVSLFVSMFTVAITIYLTVLKGTEVELYTRELAQVPSDLRSQLGALSQSVNNSEIVATGSVFILWCMLGVIIYALVMALLHAVRGSASFVGTLQFIPDNQKPHLLLEVTERLLLRLLGAAGLFGLYKFTVLGSLPILYALQKLKLQPELLSIALSITVTFVVTMLVLYLLTICLRLIMLRVRLFF